MKQHNNIEQKSEEWLHLRKGKITGTTLKAIMGTPKARQEAIYEVIAQRLTVGVETEYESDIDRGNRLEPEAIAMFELYSGKKVSQIGFRESDDSEFIANSPDGGVEETQNTEDVEVKCPAGKNYVKAWLTNKVPEEYHWQVVQYFIVNEKLETLHFVLYNPTIAMHPLHVIEVKREDIKDSIEDAKIEQVAFLNEVDDILKIIIKL